LTVALSGTNSNSFAPSTTVIPGIEAGGTDTFTVVPITGLAGGTYTAAVTVIGGNSIAANFNVSFTVNTLPTYGISLNQTGTHTFTTATAGYGAQGAKNVTITNTGNQATGALTASLSGDSSTSFTLSTTSISSIPAGGTGSFTVTPKTGLSVGVYTAAVTVSGGNSVTASFNVGFTVTGGTVPTPIITAWVTDHAINASASALTVSRSAVSPANRVTITVTPGSGYTAYAWTVQGVTQTGATGAAYTFDAAWRSNGDYTIGLALTKDGVRYSKEFTITVTN
jgi:hypothetical protein